MPRTALAKLPIEILQAEIQRRAKQAGKKLGKLLRQRAKLDVAIAELEALAGAPAPVAKGKPGPKPGAKPGRKPGRKPGPKPAAKLAAPKPKAAGKRGSYAQTAEQFILDLIAGKGCATSEITKAWQAGGRGGKADNTLSKLVASGKVKREKIKGQKGSIYSVA